MIAVKKLAAVAATLIFLLGVVFAVSMTQVHAEEMTTAVIVEASDRQAASEKETEDFVYNEMPLAEAKATVLTTNTQEKKGMPSILGFLLTAAAAVVSGAVVFMRAKLGSKKRGYLPTEDLSLFKVK